MTREELNRKIELTEELRQTESLLENVKARAGSIQSPNWDGMPHGTDIARKTELFAVEIADLEARIAYLKGQIEAQSKAIEDYCNSIPDYTLRTAFRCRYVHCMLWKEVAYMLGLPHTEDSIRERVYAYFRKQKKSA